MLYNKNTTRGEPTPLKIAQCAILVGEVNKRICKAFVVTETADKYLTAVEKYL